MCSRNCWSRDDAYVLVDWDCFEYGVKLRDVSPDCWPIIGLVRVEDDPAERYGKILVYNRPLDDHEQDGFDLVYLGETERW